MLSKAFYVPVMICFISIGKEFQFIEIDELILWHLSFYWNHTCTYHNSNVIHLILMKYSLDMKLWFVRAKILCDVNHKIMVFMHKLKSTFQKDFCKCISNLDNVCMSVNDQNFSKVLYCRWWLLYDHSKLQK